jgi:hypothetical protein
MNEDFLNVASQCRATATSDLAGSIAVDDGSGTLRELLNDAAYVIEKALVQPVQEPVAWMYTSKLKGNERFITRYQSELTTYKADEVWPLYTSPPKSTEERREDYETEQDIATLEKNITLMRDEELRVCVKEFFEKYLNPAEESDGGKMFHPITVSCCRVMMMKPLSKLLHKMCELSGAKPREIYD